MSSPRGRGWVIQLKDEAKEGGMEGSERRKGEKDHRGKLLCQSWCWKCHECSMQTQSQISVLLWKNIKYVFVYVSISLTSSNLYLQVFTPELPRNSNIVSVCVLPERPMPGQKVRLQSRPPSPLCTTLKSPGRLLGSSPPTSTNQVTFNNKPSYWTHGWYFKVCGKVWTSHGLSGGCVSLVWCP